MEQTIQVLPVDEGGVPSNVDTFMRLEGLLGSAWNSMGDAEGYLLNVSDKYADDERWKSFAIFVTEALSVKTHLGFKVVSATESTYECLSSQNTDAT